MPKYTSKITVPAINDRTKPIKANLKVSQGRISQVTVTWTPGSQWYNALIVKYEGGQIIPSEGGGECRGDGYPDDWIENIILDKPHPELNIEAWNEGNDYEHDVLISIVVLPIEIDALKPIRDMASVLKKMIGL